MFHLHSGYKVGVSISYQETDPCIGVLFVSPFITRLVIRMGILKGTDQVRVIGGAASMFLETLRLMGMLQCI